MMLLRGRLVSVLGMRDIIVGSPWIFPICDWSTFWYITENWSFPVSDMIRWVSVGMSAVKSNV